MQTRLQEKYQALIAKALLSNPVDAQTAFDAKSEQTDLLLAGIPYSSVADSLVTVTESDLKKAYDSKKEQFRQYVETRNIKYIDVQVTASQEDKDAIQKEMDEYTSQLANVMMIMLRLFVLQVLPFLMLTFIVLHAHCQPML